MSGKERINYIKENKPYLRMIGRLDNAQKQIRRVNEQLKIARNAAAQGPARAAWAARREEELYEKMNTIYARFNKTYDERVGRTK
jgi:glycogen synthase